MYDPERYKKPSKYARAADLGGKRHLAIIVGLTEETFEEDTHPTALLDVDVEHLGRKLLRINGGREASLLSFFGADDAMWRGERIVLVPAKVRFKKDLVDTIALELPRQTALKLPPKPATKPAAEPADEPDDAYLEHLSQSDD
jgi:hypothetical protein